MNQLSFLILTALADEPQHGYGMLQGIAQITGDAVKPQVATLYRTVDRLVADGLIVEHDTEVVGGRFRRRYRLTEAGLSALAAEATLQATTARIAKQRLRRANPGGLGLAGGAA